ncbi:Retrovirus-related Pol polyprotein from transposon opus, partial [Mucuna pruriens]
MMELLTNSPSYIWDTRKKKIRENSVRKKGVKSKSNREKERGLRQAIKEFGRDTYAKEALNFHIPRASMIPTNGFALVPRDLIPCANDLLPKAYINCSHATFKLSLHMCGHNKTNVLLPLQKESLYLNLETYTFCTNKVIFLGYVVGSQGVKINVKKVKVIQSWPTSKLMSNIRKLHGLARFYRYFYPCYPLNKFVKENKGHTKWVEFFKEVVRLHDLLKTIRTFRVNLTLRYSFLLPLILKQMARLRIVNTATSYSPFEFIFNLLSPLNLLPLPNVSSILNYDGLSKAHFVKDFHAKACSHIEKKSSLAIDHYLDFGPAPTRSTRNFLKHHGTKRNEVDNGCTRMSCVASQARAYLELSFASLIYTCIDLTNF